MVEKQGTSREIIKPRIVNCPLIIDPEALTLKKIMGDPKADCISLSTDTYQNLVLLRATESFWKIERSYLVKNPNFFLHQKIVLGALFRLD